MASPFAHRRTAFIEAIAAALGVGADQVEPHVRVPEAAHGDFAFPTFHLAKERKLPPAQIAQKIALNAHAPGMSFDNAGPYVNAEFEESEFATEVLTLVRSEGMAYGGGTSGTGKTVVLDYSAPNIAKPIAYHHIRSTVIGNALANIHHAHGWTVHRINYLGDWGTQFGLVAAGVAITPDFDVANATVEQLVGVYTKASELAPIESADGDNEIRDMARAFFARMEAGDEEALAFWRMIRERSIDSFKKIYARLGITFDSYEGESRYDRARTTAVIEEIVGTVGVEESEGALIVPEEPGSKDPPVLLRKADGSSLYATRDLAAAIDRFERFAFDKSLYVVATDQALHFKQVFKTLSRMGKPWADRCVHVGFGRVHGMSTRQGRIVLLNHVLDEAEARAMEKVASFPREEGDLDPETIAHVVGVGAIIFGDLRNRRTTYYEFHWEHILDFNGETGPYVQYAHARAASILATANDPSAPPEEGRQTAHFRGFDPSALVLPEEKQLLRQIARFPEAVETALVEHDPSHVARSLIGVATVFSRWYARGNQEVQDRVLCENPRLRSARLALVEATRTTIANGLHLLGVAAPQTM